MKAIFLVLATLLLAGCASRTEHGECIGIGDEKKPDLVYKVSARNLVVGIVFVETLFVPVLVVVNEFYCPVGKK